jgi:hypothetical protein
MQTLSTTRPVTVKGFPVSFWAQAGATSTVRASPANSPIRHIAFMNLPPCSGLVESSCLPEHLKK